MIVEPDNEKMEKILIQRMYRDRFPKLCDSDGNFETFGGIPRNPRKGFI